MSSRDDFTTPVAPTNTRPPRKRRDPDDPQTAAAVATPPAAAPNPPTADAPVGETPRTDVAAPAGGGTLGHVLAPPTTGDDSQTGQTHDSVSVLVGLARMRQVPVDPYADYVSDGTRKLRWVQAAIEQVAQLTNRTRQEVETRALLGIEPLPTDVLEANWQAVYGYKRSEYQPPHR